MFIKISLPLYFFLSTYRIFRIKKFQNLIKTLFHFTKYVLNLDLLKFIYMFFYAVAPEAVKVRAQPEELKPGIEATLYCDAASSNPPAVLSWWRDGIPVQGKC